MEKLRERQHLVVSASEADTMTPAVLPHTRSIWDRGRVIFRVTQFLRKLSFNSCNYGTTNRMIFKDQTNENILLFSFTALCALCVFCVCVFFFFAFLTRLRANKTRLLELSRANSPEERLKTSILYLFPFLQIGRIYASLFGPLFYDS